MEVMERINALLECGFSTAKEHQDLSLVIAVFQKKGIIVTEENAGVMITHMAAAFRRGRTGELIEPLADEGFAQITESPYFIQANELMKEIAGQISSEVSEREQRFFLLHICTLLAGAGSELDYGVSNG